MNARQFRDRLRDVLDELDGIAQVTTFDEAGLLTGDDGLVIEADDGATFQLTIVEA